MIKAETSPSLTAVPDTVGWAVTPSVDEEPVS